MSKEDIQTSDWQTYEEIYTFQGTVPQVKKKIRSFNRKFPEQEIQYQLQFQSYSHLEKYQKSLEDVNQMFYHKDTFNQKNEFQTIFHELHKRKLQIYKKDVNLQRYFKIEFRKAVELSIFFLNYQSRIRDMEYQYNYVLIQSSKHMFVFLKLGQEYKLNSFFTNQIMEMKQKLKYYHLKQDKEIYEKMVYSKMAQNILLKNKIKFVTQQKHKSVTFYGQSFRNCCQMIQQIKDLLSYHISIIVLEQVFCDPYICHQLFLLLIQQLNPFLSQIQQQYQVPIQINTQTLSIVVNIQHEIFDHSVRIIKQEFFDISLLQLECQGLISIKDMLKSKAYQGILKFRFKYRKCFILFSHKLTQHASNGIHKFCKDFSQFFGAKYRIVIHFIHLFHDWSSFQKQKSRTLNLTNFYCLNIPNYHIVMKNNYSKIIIEPKQTGKYGSSVRKYQIQLFLKDFILNIVRKPQQKCQLINFKTHLNEQNNQCQSIATKLNESRFIMDKCIQLIKQPAQQTIQTKIQIESFQQKSLLQLFQFQKPVSINLQGIAYRKLKRNHEVQAKLQKKMKKSVKAWKIVINQSIELPVLSWFSNIQFLKDPFKETGINRFCLKNYSQIQQKNYNDKTKLDQLLFMCFTNKDQDIFIPAMLVQFISH